MNDLRKARDNFILEASLILEHHLKRATGQADILDIAECDPKNHSVFMNRLLDMIEPLQDIQKIDAQNTAEVLKLLSTGKISIDECLKLMDVLVQKANVDMIDYTIKNPTNEKD